MRNALALLGVGAPDAMAKMDSQPDSQATDESTTKEDES